ncbi:hypothetical protein [Microbacterium sp. RG1]|uniref:hypothetical protein n=1 Tax=Microbacterium sp. RG1 TaxID=2489212 RepID=UPI0010CA307B|nr:hypothetical protein [Microbacterium sp. RG1]QCQ16915.1 hypothetical protein EHF32_09405 [Microbacterium sp. RG1]
MTTDDPTSTTPSPAPPTSAPAPPTMAAADAAASYTPPTAPEATPTRVQSRRPRGLVIGAIAAGAVLALGASFGGGIATGWALSGTASTSQFQDGGFGPGGSAGDGERPEFGQGGPGGPQQDGTMPTRPDEDSTTPDEDSGSGS